MIIRSRKVWIAGQFVPADIETENGKIAEIRPCGEREADADYGEKRIVPALLICTPTAPTAMTPTTGSRRD